MTKQMTFDQAVEQLAKAAEKTYQTGDSIVREGDKMVIPERFGTLPQVASAILRIHKNLEEEVQTKADFDCHPHDGMVSFYRAVTETFGTLMGAATESFFGKIPGRSMTIPIGAHESVNVPLGLAEVPGLPIQMDVRPSMDEDEDNGGSLSVIYTYQRKYEALVNRITELTEKYLAEHSIFRGKAIDSDFKFLDLTKFRPESVVYAGSVRRQINANILAPIRYTKTWSERSPLKRGILLYGPYGTGKTLTALLTASECEKHGWTFINVRPGASITKALRLARKYAPATVFFEDIDQETDGERDGALNEILNTVDGIVSKGDAVMTILTTNHISRITKGMLRPGRLDSIIQLGDLDKDAVERLVKVAATTRTGKSLLDVALDFDQIFAAARDFPAAFVTESVTKASAYMLERTGGDGAEMKIGTSDIVEALKELRPQFELMTGTQERDLPRLDSAFNEMIEQKIKPLQTALNEIQEHFDN